MSSSTDRRTGSRAKSAPLPRLRWPSDQDSPSKRDRNVGGAPRHEDEGEQEAHQDPFVVEAMRQLALSVIIVLALGFFFIRIFGPNDASVLGASNEASRTPPASLANAPQAPWAPPPAAAARLEVDFDRPAPAGQPVPLRLNVADAPEGSIIVISGMGPSTTLSAGENRDLEWRLGQADWPNISVIPPKDFVGSMVLVVELRLPDGAVAGRQIVRPEWAGEARAERTSQAAQVTPPSGAPEASEAAPSAPAAEPVAETGQDKQFARALPSAAPAPAPTETPAQAEAPSAPQAAAPRAEAEENKTDLSPCYAKLDGKVVLKGSCRVASVEGKSVTFESGENRLSLTFDHGRVWRLKWNDEDKGKIFKREECWGSEKAFVCEHPPRPRPKS